MKRNIRVLVYRDGDLCIAQGLDIDIAAQGPTEAAARDRWFRTVAQEIGAARALGEDPFAIGPAPEPFFKMWDEADQSMRLEVAA